MKKIFLTLCLGGAFALGNAQSYNIPAASPREMVQQQFSISNISVDYGRPGVKGRKIFGDLVPFAKIWRAGANSSTKITLGQAVNFGGKEVKAGTYGLFILPQPTQWTIILNKDSQSWGAYSYDEKQNVLETTLPVEHTKNLVEWFTIDLNPVNKDETTLSLSWENSLVKIPIKVANTEAVTKITEKLNEARKIEREATIKK